MGTARQYRLAASVVASLLATSTAPAWARKNDLNLLNLCGGTACSWVQRRDDGWIESAVPDGAAKEAFRSLMSELGAVLAPRIPMSAQTMGFSGFQITGELALTRISNHQRFWDGVDGVSANNPAATRPDSALSTIGVFLRKGLWLPLPSAEVGAGVVHLLDSQMLDWQAYAKFALHEGFNDWPIPSFAVRGSLGYLTGTDQVRLTTASLDLLASRSFGVLKTTRLEPLAGVSFMFIDARSGAIDATPSCDGHALANNTPGTGSLGGCYAAQQGSANDLGAVVSFPEQDTIVRYRLFGGAKLRFGVAFLLAQYEFFPAGRTRDQSEPGGARDQSAAQSALSMSAGLDF